MFSIAADVRPFKLQEAHASVTPVNYDPMGVDQKVRDFWDDHQKNHKHMILPTWDKLPMVSLGPGLLINPHMQSDQSEASAS